MNYTYPHSIENIFGEKLIFHDRVPERDGDKLIVENFVTPGNGPIMHVHFLQDESLTVIKGKIGYQVLGQPEKFAGEGETVTFKRGVPHRFWNAGNDILNCKGWVKPANTIEFFLSTLYNSQNKSGKPQPSAFDGAYLMYRYRKEYDLPQVPGFVKKVIFPITYAIGNLFGKYKKFKNAPEPVK